MNISPFLKIIMTAMTLLFFYHSFRDKQRYLNYLQLRKSRNTLEKAVLQLESKKTKLKTEITKIRNSKDYARKVLRDNYHLIEEDERIIFFAD